MAAPTLSQAWTAIRAAFAGLDPELANDMLVRALVRLVGADLRDAEDPLDVLARLRRREEARAISWKGHNSPIVVSLSALCKVRSNHASSVAGGAPNSDSFVRTASRLNSVEDHHALHLRLRFAYRRRARIEAYPRLP
jgi:hypothetical protein